MKNKNFLKVLRRMGACDEALAWAERHGGSAKRLWSDCRIGSWLTFLISRLDGNEELRNTINAVQIAWFPACTGSLARQLRKRIQWREVKPLVKAYLEKK